LQNKSIHFQHILVTYLLTFKEEHKADLPAPLFHIIWNNFAIFLLVIAIEKLDKLAPI